jgi:hypothetical protein
MALEFSRVNSRYVGRVSGSWVGDDITEDSLRCCTTCWGFCTRRFLIQSLLSTETHLGFHVKCLILAKMRMCREILLKLLNIQFDENLFVGFVIVPCGQSKLGEANIDLFFQGLVTKA